MTPDEIEVAMSVVALITNAHWIPQLTRLVKRKESDDFSLWTTLILLSNNIVWFAYAGYINSPSLTIQQGLTLVMLLVFGSLIIRYRTTPLLWSEKAKHRWERLLVFGILLPVFWVFAFIKNPKEMMRR